MVRLACSLLLGAALLIPVQSLSQTRSNGVKKDPQLAQVLALITVGGGHIYAAETATGITLMALPSAAWVGAIVLNRRYEDCTSNVDFFGRRITSCRNGSFLRQHGGTIAASAISVGAWLFGILDADNAARAYNREHDLAVYPSGTGVTLVYTFN